MITSPLALLQRPVLLLLLFFSVPAFSVDISQATGLASKLTSELGVTPKQAEGGAGSLLKLAGENLSSADFSKVTSAIPDATALLSAAPSVGSSLPMVGLDTSDLAGKALPIFKQFESLGLDSDMVSKFGGVIANYLKSSGGSGISGLFKNALPGDLLDSSSGSVMNLLK